MNRLDGLQTLGCGAHARIIAPPHVQCAFEKGLKMCVRCASVHQSILLTQGPIHERSILQILW